MFLMLLALGRISLSSGEPVQYSQCSSIPQSSTQIGEYLFEICGEQQRQSSNLAALSKILSRVESHRQDLYVSMDRSETRLGQRIDGIKGDIRQVLTLQEKIREDLEVVQAQQTSLSQDWFEEKLQSFLTQYKSNKSLQSKKEDQNTSAESTSDDKSANILKNIQTIQNGLYSLRRTVTTIQNDIKIIQRNVSTMENSTRALELQGKDLVKKQYLLRSLNDMENKRIEARKEIIYATEDKSLQNLPKDCHEILINQSANKSGVYLIRPKSSRKSILVYCDMETDGGGWTMFQRRKDGTIDFQQNWLEYKYGFGNIHSEFWLGNDHIHQLTNQDIYELRVDLQDFELGHAYSLYSAFAVAEEKHNYRISLLGDISGDAGDGLSYHAGIPFSTMDNDNDRWPGGNCAKDHKGGWWYNQCDASNLNGVYLSGITPQAYQGVYWHEWQGPNYSLKTTTMMIRPANIH